ncbi:uncharacterized protein [Apostichopus japonicus]|uniref:uncharacterized protein n=1 Tax=Stichopus japonicus TaxID=307972 RepID=UPI003AB3AB3B
MIALTYLINDVLTGKAGQDKENVLLKLTDALAFLGSSNIDLNHDLFKPELKADTINTARSSLSALLDHVQRNTIGSYPLISRFLKGIFELRTPYPRYTIWDVSIVLNYLRNTLSRWIKLVLEQAGVHVVQYAAHSTRAASTSAADSRNLPVDDILRTVGWASGRTFVQYYKKPIVSNKTFAMAVLDA